MRLLRSLEEEPGMPRLHVTFFAAHAIPPEYFGRHRDYVQAVGSWLGDAAQAGADGVDVYCDNRQFTTEDARWILTLGRAAGLKTRIHACSKPRHGAVRMAAEMQCNSVDLLHETDEEDLVALARTKTPVVVCPTASLNECRTPPVRALLDHGVPVALGTDHNPAHCGTTMMSLVVCMAIGLYGLSVQEALRAATVGGAQALGTLDRGVIAVGKVADVVQWDAEHEGAFAWSYGLKAMRVWRGGEPLR